MLGLVCHRFLSSICDDSVGQCVGRHGPTYPHTRLNCAKLVNIVIRGAHSNHRTYPVRTVSTMNMVQVTFVFSSIDTIIVSTMEGGIQVPYASNLRCSSCPTVQSYLCTIAIMAYSEQ